MKNLWGNIGGKDANNDELLYNVSEITGPRAEIEGSNDKPIIARNPNVI